MLGIINQIVGFFQTLGLFLTYLSTMIFEASTFIPSYVQGALLLFATVAGLLLVLKIVISVFNFIGSAVGGILTKFIGM